MIEYPAKAESLAADIVVSLKSLPWGFVVECVGGGHQTDGQSERGTISIYFNQVNSVGYSPPVQPE